MMNMNAQASASTSVLPLPWSEDAHRLRGPFSASTPVITLASSVAQDVIVEEPDELSPPSATSPKSARLNVPSPRSGRGVAPSQSEDESMHLALVLAFGNDKYSNAFASPTSPPVKNKKPTRGLSSPPSYFKSPVRGKFTASPGPTPPHSPSSTPKQRDSREQPRQWQNPIPEPRELRSPRRSSESESEPSPRPRAISTSSPLPDLRFESDYNMDSPVSATSSSGGGGLGSNYRNPARRSTYNLNSQPLRKPEGTVMLPLPLMLRPRPIWRTTPRSALSSPAYAPAAHLVRRSTFIAAGLDLESPVADLSAFAVETRNLMFGRDAGVVLPGFDV